MSVTKLDQQMQAELRANKLAQLQTASTQAKNWLAGLTGLIGLVTTVTILKGPSTTADLGPWQLWAVIVLTVLSLIAFGLGIWYAYSAAYGEPGLPEIDTTTIAGLHGRVITARTKAAGKITSALKIGVLATAAGVVLLVAANIVSWVPPTASTPSASSLCVYVGATKLLEVNGSSIDVRSIGNGTRVGPC